VFETERNDRTLQGHGCRWMVVDFGTNRKRMGLPIGPQWQPWPYLAAFQTLLDFCMPNGTFPYHTHITVKLSGMVPLD